MLGCGSQLKRGHGFFRTSQRSGVTTAPRRLPKEAKRLCELVVASWKLIAHLPLVHHVAVDLTEAAVRAFPKLSLCMLM